MAKTKVYKRYSESFKRQVVAEYEEGASPATLCRKYGIGSANSVRTWVKKYAAESVRYETVHVQTPDEADQLRQLERERDLLQRAVADLTVENLLLEGQLRVYQETCGEAPLKKNEPASSSTPTPLGRDA
jgi:transposase-like protein